jgi:hypothetical protein
MYVLRYSRQSRTKPHFFCSLVKDGITESQLKLTIPLVSGEGFFFGVKGQKGDEAFSDDVGFVPLL